MEYFEDKNLSTTPRLAKMGRFETGSSACYAFIFMGWHDVCYQF